MAAAKKILAIDSSTELCSVCYTDGVRWIERREDAGQRHSALIVSLIESALAEAGCGVADLDEVAFGAGPGSFTGLRIACGIAQGLAFGASIPVRAVSSLMALAQASGRPAVIAAIDARMSEVYWAAYRLAGAGCTHQKHAQWIEIVPPAAAPAARVIPPAGEDWAGAGNAFARFTTLVATMPSSAHIDSGVEVTARCIAELAASGQGVLDDAEHAIPVYVRNKVAMTSLERAAAR